MFDDELMYSVSFFIIVNNLTGNCSLPHTLTHTTISASKQARMYWTYDLWISTKKRLGFK